MALKYWEDNSTEAQARARELANIYWQKEEVRNQLRALRAKDDPHYDYPHYDPEDVDKLRAMLSRSWSLRIYKRYEVARALALGWWYQLTVKEQRDIVDGAVTVFICVAVIAVFGWLSSH